MKKITIAPPVTIPEAGRINQITGERESMLFDMVKWLNTCMNQHEKFGKGFEGVSQGLKIKTAYESAKEEFQLEDTDFNELKKAVSTASLNPMVGMACKIFYDAIENAVDIEVNKTK